MNGDAAHVVGGDLDFAAVNAGPDLKVK